MSHLIKAGMVLLVSRLCCAQPVTPADALDRYLARQHDTPAGCFEPVFTVQIDASLPKLRKHGSMRGLKLISRTGQVVYRGLRFTGDNLIKTAVIARFLSSETQHSGRGASVARENYSFVYEGTFDYNGIPAYVFHLKPRRRRVGVFNGELWLEADTAEPLRLWGDFVKSPSIFISRLRFVQDYQVLNRCAQPLRLLVTVHTRIAGEVEMAEWLHPATAEPAGSDRDTSRAFEGGSVQ
ncbi:MAG TPA: hypothetical protein VMT86_20350 [Bryobacteraceae bacterium]|nr:hypothetical protein [Bryobacteraceae bacterium]